MNFSEHLVASRFWKATRSSIRQCDFRLLEKEIWSSFFYFFSHDVESVCQLGLSLPTSCIAMGTGQRVHSFFFKFLPWTQGQEPGMVSSFLLPASWHQKSPVNMDRHRKTLAEHQCFWRKKTGRWFGIFGFVFPFFFHYFLSFSVGFIFVCLY